MTCREMIDYFSGFDPDEEVAFVVVDLEQRLVHKIFKCGLLLDSPAVLLETVEKVPLDENSE